MESQESRTSELSSDATYLVGICAARLGQEQGAGIQQVPLGLGSQQQGEAGPRGQGLAGAEELERP